MSILRLVLYHPQLVPRWISSWHPVALKMSQKWQLRESTWQEMQYLARIRLGLNQLFLRLRYITVKAQPKDKSSIWKMRQRQIVWGHKILILGLRWSKIVDHNRKLWETPRPTAACPITKWIALLPVELPQEKILQQACSPKTPSQILRKLTLREKHSEEISRG